MAIVKMSKLKLIGIKYYKEQILNALTKTDSVEIIATSEIDKTDKASLDTQNTEISIKKDKATRCVDFILSEIDKNKKEAYADKDVKSLSAGFFVSFDEFMDVPKSAENTEKLIDSVLEKENRLLSLKTEKTKLINLIDGLKIYESTTVPLSMYSDTESSKIFFGTVKSDVVKKLKSELDNYSYTVYKFAQVSSDLQLLTVASLNVEGGSIGVLLNENGFTACPYKYGVTAKEKIAELKEELANIEKEEKAIGQEIYKIGDSLNDIKLYADYQKFTLEKQTVAEEFRETATTFVLEAYVPEYRVEAVKEKVNGTSNGAVFMEFSEPTEEDEPPTMLKNNVIVRQTEFITEMYSVPSYRELDPSKIVFFFFMLFMGVIMADVGYGLLMVLVGTLLARKIKVDNGTRRLWYIVAIGGVFAGIFGALFNSYLGFSLPYEAIIPSPIPKGNGTVDLMTVLLLCLLLGVVQLGTGYLFKAINDFRKKDIASGIFDGLVWVIFFIGFIFAAFNFIVAYLMPTVSLDTPIFEFFALVQMPGVYMVIGAVVIAALTAGRNEKGFGKFSKGFGAVYGIINLLSDILSYARLFGLLLSGMIIATTFNDMGLGMILGGGAGYFLGGLIIVIGHVFNLAMNVLGAYIHDSRLQYIEFFSKFYTGEGRKFVPFGSEFSYVYLKK